MAENTACSKCSNGIIGYIFFSPSWHFNSSCLCLCLFIGIVLPCYRESVSTHRESLAGEALSLHPGCSQSKRIVSSLFQHPFIQSHGRCKLTLLDSCVYPWTHHCDRGNGVLWLVCLSHMPTVEAKGHMGHFEWQFHVEIRVLGWRNKNISCSVCLTLCNPMDCSPPGSSAHGILQARILEWVAIPFSKGSSWPRDRTQISYTASKFLTIWATREAQN